jgi:signal transduction histidine kinase
MADRAAIAIENGRLYDAVKAADRAKSEFVSIVAHELKVPMTSISGYAALLEVVGELNTKQKEFRQRIENGVERMKVLVSDLSDISRIESGHLKIVIEPVSMKEVLDQAIEAVVEQIKERRHTLKQEVPASLPHVKGDKSRIVQVLVNLLSNAYKYTPDGGTITLQVKPDDTTKILTIGVQDTGIGMTSEQIKKLGTKFYRVDNEYVQQQSGTGLGFAITRNLIELMHGKLIIESKVGEGSTFTFSLPTTTTN